MNLSFTPDEVSLISIAVGNAIGAFDILSKGDEPLTDTQKMGCIKIRERLNEIAEMVQAKYVDGLVPRTRQGH